MREVGGGRTRRYWISFILSLVSLWIVFVYSLLGPGIPLTEALHILRDLQLPQSMHTLRHRHTRASNGEYAMHILRGQVFRGQRK